MWLTGYVGNSGAAKWSACLTRNNLDVYSMILKLEIIVTGRHTTVFFLACHKLYLRVGHGSMLVVTIRSAPFSSLQLFILFCCSSPWTLKFQACCFQLWLKQDHIGFLATRDHLTKQSQIMRFICCELLFYFLWNLLGGCYPFMPSFLSPFNVF